jgi:hypothetical protein
MSLQVLRSSDADLDAYAVWAASVVAEDSTIDGDGLLSASHATHVMLQRFASGEQAIAPAFGNSTKTIHLAQLHFVEYRNEESNSLAGLLVANLGADEAEPVRILRVLVSQDHRSGGVARPSKSVMTQLGHALITHAIHHRSHGSTLPPRIDFRLAEVACVMAHMPKWSRIFETYAQQTPAPGCTQIITSADHRQSPIFVWWPASASPLHASAALIRTAGEGKLPPRASARVAPSPRIVCQVI